MKSIFVVFDLEDGNKRWAVAETIRTGTNLVAHLRDITSGTPYRCNYAHLCESRKEAAEIALLWNESYKRNGTSLYS